MRRLIALGLCLAAMGFCLPARAEPVKVSKTDCAKLVRHKPAANVEYQPGVDAKGRKVAPADLDGGSKIKLPEEFTIDIGMDLVKKYGITGASPNLYTAEANKLGVVTVKNGKASFNGQPLTPEDEDALAEACRKKGVK